MSSDSMSVSSDLSENSNDEDEIKVKGVSSVGDVKVVDIPSIKDEVVSSSDENNSDDQLTDDSPRSKDEQKSSSKKRCKRKSSTVKLKDGTVIDLTPPEKLLRKSESRARYLETKGKEDESVKEYIRCAALTRLVYGEGHWKLASSHVQLASAYLTMKGLAPQAIYHAEIARNLLLGGLHTSDSQHTKDQLRSTLQLMYYVFGRANTILKKYPEAEQNFAKAEKLTQEDRASGDMKIKILVAMAKLYANQNKHALGESYYEQALDEIQSQHGKESLQLIQVYQDMGKISYLEQSKGKHANHDKAVEAYLQAHSIASSKYSGQSEEVAETAHKLALAYSESATTEAEVAAEQYLDESIGILQVIHGPHHSKTIAVQDDLCRLLIRTDRIEEAVSLLKDLIAAKIATFGDWSEEVGDAYKLHGSIQMSQGQLERALKNFKKCHNIQCNLYGSNHRKAKATQNTIDMLLQSPVLAAKEEKTKAGQLKTRPRFNATLPRSSSSTSRPVSDY